MQVLPTSFVARLKNITFAFMSSGWMRRVVRPAFFRAAGFGQRNVMGRKCWYVLGMRYVSAGRTAEEMTSAGFECFVPPGISNMLFVHSPKEEIDGFLTYNAGGRPLYYMRSLADGCPLVVPDRDMMNFILVCRGSDTPIVMQECPKVKLGDRVRVIAGPLKGVEGNVVRMRKQKRILVAVSSVLWVATAYVRPELLEILT